MKINDQIPAKKKTLRPTTGKVREALFNILRDRIRDSRFLDLYAGSGLIGIEALKKGASEVVLVEASKIAAKEINEMISKDCLTNKARVVVKKALSFIEWAGADELTFDIIFLDPPYHTDEIMHALSAIDNASILKHNGIVIAEHFKKRALPDGFNSLIKSKEYRYGDTVLSLYEPV